uniref:Ammonium transporter AmtB-like domain-containing protein n=1 Tax=Lotus japonicus TaxID=34305 RepID=I3S6F0_LOTJA|nr:unknown [Lotus japonicus]
MTGLFAEQTANPSGGYDGAFYGRPIQLWYQIAAILTAIVFAATSTAGILYPLDWIIGIRLAKEDELEGLDLAAHGEGWEVVASRAVGDLVKKVLANQHTTRNEICDNGTFELRYTPTDPTRQSFKVNIPNLSKATDDPVNSPSINHS